MPEPTPNARPSLFLAWILMVVAGIGTLLVGLATIVYWDTFDTLGKLIATAATIFAFGALVALILAFFTTIFLPAVHRARQRAQP